MVQKLIWGVCSIVLSVQCFAAQIPEKLTQERLTQEQYNCVIENCTNDNIGTWAS